MKKIILALSFLLVFSFQAFADSGTLSAPYQLQPTEAVYVDWDFNLGTASNAVSGKHRWKDANGVIISLPESRQGGWIYWTLKNHKIDPIPAVDNQDCVGADDPNACCAGAHPNPGNTCDDLVDMPNSACNDIADPAPCCTGLDQGVCEAWDDTALFDCGASACDDYIIGVGLRTLILNQWKKIYCPGCTITF